MAQTSRLYSLRKSRHILNAGYRWHYKKKQALSPDLLRHFETKLKALDSAIENKDRPLASTLGHEVEDFCGTHFKKSVGMYLLELFFSIVVALVVATIIRQMWFEPYEIPTGSMRPTFKEQDHLTVTKTAFGINVPLATEHFYFDPTLVQRTSVVVWSGDGVPHLDSSDTFMKIFPYTKRYIKRCMGKPGDTLYFYGGKIYGFDKEGKDLIELRNNPWTKHIEHVPFTNFEGRRSYVENKRLKTATEVVFNHFNEATGRFRFANATIKGEVFNGKEWIEDSPTAQQKPHDTIQTYSDFSGIRNFAEARILNKEQLENLTPYLAKDMEEALLYLELRHTPSLSFPAPFLSDRFIAIKGYSTVIPLQEKHLQALMHNMYTCRFVVKNGRASSYRMGSDAASSTSPAFPGIADGTYEFYYGKASQIDWGGIAFACKPDHPLYSMNPKNIQKLFNVGIDMNTSIEPSNRNQPFFPNRYVYFREGALYTMGGILFEKNDPILMSFHQREKKKEELSTSKAPYVAFKDYGAPLKEDGELDKEFITTFGYQVPQGHYLMLGDNHAMSQDSRYFGPVPERCLQGAPSVIVWPPGERWGIPNQRPYPLFTLPRLIVWSIAATAGLIWYCIHRRNVRRMRNF